MQIFFKEIFLPLYGGITLEYAEYVSEILKANGVWPDAIPKRGTPVR